MKVFVEDNILIKDRMCRSKILRNFKPPYSATAVEKILAAGMEITDTEDGADVTLGTSAPDNMFYIRPTYGTVSRYGLVADVSSMDQIGVGAESIDDAFAVLAVIAGHDERDGTSLPAEKYEYYPYEGDLSIYTGGCDYLYEVYTIISAAEFCGNIARFDGFKFGYRAENFSSMDELVIKSRSEAFTLEAKLKAMMGAYVLSEGQFEKYYQKAVKARRIIKQSIGELFRQDNTVIRVPDMTISYLTGFPALAAPGGKIYLAYSHKECLLWNTKL